jgi:hypothetical protein
MKGKTVIEQAAEALAQSLTDPNLAMAMEVLAQDLKDPVMRMAMCMIFDDALVRLVDDAIVPFVCLPGHGFVFGDGKPAPSIQQAWVNFKTGDAVRPAAVFEMLADISRRFDEKYGPIKSEVESEPSEEK